MSTKEKSSEEKIKKRETKRGRSLKEKLNKKGSTSPHPPPKKKEKQPITRKKENPPPKKTK